MCAASRPVPRGPGNAVGATGSLTEAGLREGGEFPGFASRREERRRPAPPAPWHSTRSTGIPRSAPLADRVIQQPVKSVPLPRASALRGRHLLRVLLRLLLGDLLADP